MQHFNLPITKFKREPWAWQREAIYRASIDQNFAFFAEQGTGKTCALINTLRCRYSVRTRIMKTLILAPVVTLQNWKDEFKEHSFVNSSDVIILKGSKKQKLDRFAEGTEFGTKNKIILLNYESLITKEILDVLLAYGIEIFVADESHYLKSHKSKRSKAAVLLADRAIHRYLLTGTPILKGVDDIFMQYRIMDGGETFGKSYSVFVGKYMMDMNAGWRAKPNYFPNWVTNPNKYDELNTAMYKKAIRVLKKDCLDLPPLIKQKIIVEMGPEQRKAYKEMERDFITFVQSKEKEGTPKAVVAELAISKAMKLQQIVTGYVTDEDGTVHEFTNNPRLAAIKEKLELLTPNNKVIIWCSFTYNYTQLGRVCEQLGIKHVYITGKQNTDQKNESIQSFRTDDEVRVVIANRRAGGIGINLIEASYSLVYSRNFSLNDELQSEARNYRGGSEMHTKVTKIDFAAEGTIDLTVMEALNEKKDISKNVLDLIR